MRMPETTLTRPETLADPVDLLLNPEIQEALTTVVQHLPKLAKMTTVLAKACDVSMEVMTDGDLLQGVAETVAEKTRPLQQKAKDCMEVLQEARQRAALDNSRVSLFGLLRLLKDPTVQKNLRFIQALLAVLSERELAPSPNKNTTVN